MIIKADNSTCSVIMKKGYKIFKVNVPKEYISYMWDYAIKMHDHNEGNWFLITSGEKVIASYHLADADAYIIKKYFLGVTIKKYTSTVGSLIGKKSNCKTQFGSLSS